MAEKTGLKNTEETPFITSGNFDSLCQVSEKISHLSDLKTTLDEILTILPNVTECRHLAIRIIDSSGNIPIYSQFGLEKKFVESEHWVTLKDCMCGYVAKGKIDKTLPFFTEFGSFYTNSISHLNAAIQKHKHRLKNLNLRNVCQSCGYESVAIIPVKIQNSTIAELYLSDERKGLFPLEKVRFFEKLTVQIGIAIQNSQLYTSLMESQEKVMDLFDSASIGIIELDTKGTVIQINQKGSSLFGYSYPKKLLDNSVKMNELNLDKDAWDSFIEDIDTEEVVVNRVLQFYVGHQNIHLEISLKSIKDKKKNTVGYRGTFHDVTDSVRLEEERLNKVKAESLKNRYFQETQILKDELKSKYPFEEMIGSSRAIQDVKKAIQLVASTETTVLIKGETGTGKELVARYIHELSARKDRILVKVNCAALSEGLIASELFGHEKGAFTGAIQKRIGRFEYADKATIFLDEIGDLPLETQAMLLRAVQDGEFERVGSSKTIKIDVRLLAATNRDLSLLVEEKKFRQDLFFRLNVFPIDVPPLRERREDIPLLSAYFLEQYGRKQGKKIDRVKEETMQIFLDYSWPGNVRELQNIIEHGLVISKKGIFEIPEAYFRHVPAGGKGSKLIPMDEYEKHYIIKVLRFTQGTLYGDNGAASILGMKPSTLQSRMKKLDIDRKQFQD
ncbi:MAG: sigma 54-interacting transcriptional regulator [Candidatus Aminicenantes bacterium]|nr:sigma 54-interacting transcriptional regulator [Candidatus Aminicenantes bacterium]